MEGPADIHRYDMESIACEKIALPHYDQALSNLAQVLSHRLRGLITGIEGFVDLLTDTLKTPEQRELARRVFEGAARIEGILADLQLYGQRLEPALLPYGICEAVRDLLVLVPDEERHRVTLAIELAEDRMLWADPFLIRQALLVLVRNALDATQQQGRVWVVAAEDRARRQVRIEVWNDGTIDLEVPERKVFLPFFTTKVHNLGVGLSIARRIAELHGGMLHLTNNTQEEGTCFSLFLPLPAEEKCPA